MATLAGIVASLRTGDLLALAASEPATDQHGPRFVARHWGGVTGVRWQLTRWVWDRNFLLRGGKKRPTADAVVLAVRTAFYKYDVVYPLWEYLSRRWGLPYIVVEKWCRPGRTGLDDYNLDLRETLTRDDVLSAISVSLRKEGDHAGDEEYE
jgi:hypothetical protein